MKGKILRWNCLAFRFLSPLSYSTFKLLLKDWLPCCFFNFWISLNSNYFILTLHWSMCSCVGNVLLLSLVLEVNATHLIGSPVHASFMCSILSVYCIKDQCVDNHCFFSGSQSFLDLVLGRCSSRCIMASLRTSYLQLFSMIDIVCMPIVSGLTVLIVFLCSGMVHMSGGNISLRWRRFEARRSSSSAGTKIALFTRFKPAFRF